MSRRVHRKEGRSTNILLNRFIMCGERREWTFGHSDQNCIFGSVCSGGEREGGGEGGRGGREEGRVRKEGGMNVLYGSEGMYNT